MGYILALMGLIIGMVGFCDIILNKSIKQGLFSLGLMLYIIVLLYYFYPDILSHSPIYNYIRLFLP